MKSLMALVTGALVLTAPCFAQTAPAPLGTFASAADVQAAMKKAEAAHKGKSDNENVAIRLLGIGPYPVSLEYRTGETPPAIHKGEVEYIEIIKGAADFRIGGTLNGMTTSATGTIRGTSITGGTVTKASEGDYIVVPADAPHVMTPTKTPFVIITTHIPAPANAKPE